MVDRSFTSNNWKQGRIQGGGGTHPARPPPKIGKNKIFWREIVIFHTKYPNNFRAYLRSAQFFKCAPPNLKSWIRPWEDTTILTNKNEHQ